MSPPIMLPVCWEKRTLPDAKSLPADFQSAVARFRAFLRQNKYPENIVWLMPEDVLLSGKRFLYVRVPVSSANEVKARKIYDDGLANGRGLLMSTICEMKDSTCCYLFYPRRGEEEPQGLWPQDGSVKLSAKLGTSRVAGKPVKNRLLWAFLKLRNRRKQNLKRFIFSGVEPKNEFPS